MFSYISGMNKVCCSCKKSKLVNEFYKDKTTYDGFGGKCKKCAKASTKQWQKENPKKARLIELNTRDKQNKIFGYGVYTFIHLPTQKYYIGEGWLFDRHKNHISKLKSNTHTSTKLQHYYNQYPNLNEWQFKTIKKWKTQTLKGRKLETKLIQEGLKNNPSTILNKKI